MVEQSRQIAIRDRLRGDHVRWGFRLAAVACLGILFACSTSTSEAVPDSTSLQALQNKYKITQQSSRTDILNAVWNHSMSPATYEEGDEILRYTDDKGQLRILIYDTVGEWKINDSTTPTRYPQIKTDHTKQEFQIDSNTKVRVYCNEQAGQKLQEELDGENGLDYKNALSVYMTDVQVPNVFNIVFCDQTDGMKLLTYDDNWGPVQSLHSIATTHAQFDGNKVTELQVTVVPQNLDMKTQYTGLSPEQSLAGTMSNEGAHVYSATRINSPTLWTQLKKREEESTDIGIMAQFDRSNVVGKLFGGEKNWNTFYSVFQEITSEGLSK